MAQHSTPGGGSGLARPGAVSRAHRGVLFLDECAEIGVSAMEALRTPLEEGEIRLARRDGVARYPARFQLVAPYVLVNIVPSEGALWTAAECWAWDMGPATDDGS
jgi:predicted ATPase with chaperone activity